MFSYEPIHMDMQVVDDLLELYNSSVETQDVLKKTCWKQWMIEMNGEREKSVLAVWHDDDNEA